MALLIWLIVLGAAFFIYRLAWSSPRIPANLKELPGPKGYPFVGNLFDIPPTQAYLKFKDLSEIYGPIFKLDILGNTHVIISKQKIAEDLLAKRSAIYSDRGLLHMVKLVTGGGDLLANGQNDYWRRGRRFAGAMLTPAMASQWEPFQAREAKRMTADMVTDPGRYAYWFERFSTAVSLREGFGRAMGSEEEEKYHTGKILNRMHHIERIATPGAYLVEVIPALMYVPEFLAPFKREAKVLNADESTYFKSLLDGACRDHKESKKESPPSFARCWLDKADHWELSTAEVTYVIGTMYGGGAGTTAGAMQSFILAMCHHPEWQLKLQEELDRVVGPLRAPSFSDSPQLPLVRAVAKEVLRWRPVVPGNLPHRLTQDDVYEGYHIPGGALVHGNQWAIHRGEELYPDAETFKPDRWLDPKYPTCKVPLEQYPNVTNFSAFGFGRRICPGLETAQRSMFIQIASLAWACHISKKTNEMGEKIPVPWYDYTEGSNVAPKPFLFDLKARSEKKVEIMREGWAAGLV